MKNLVFAVAVALSMPAFAAVPAAALVAEATSKYEARVVAGQTPVDALKAMLKDGIDPMIVFEVALAKGIDLSDIAPSTASGSDAQRDTRSFGNSNFGTSPGSTFNNGSGGSAASASRS